MHYLILLGALLLATPAWAGTWDRACNGGFTGAVLDGTVVGTSTNNSQNIGPGQMGCYRYEDTNGAHFSSETDTSSYSSPASTTDGNVVIQITAESAFWVYTPTLGAATTSPSGEVTIRYCSGGKPLDPDDPDDDCVSLGTLNGVEGGGTGGAIMRTGPGVYVIHVSGACAGGVTCQVSVRGEGLQQ
jgi:hypothetical protein